MFTKGQRVRYTGKSKIFYEDFMIGREGTFEKLENGTSGRLQAYVYWDYDQSRAIGHFPENIEMISNPDTDYDESNYRDTDV